MRRNVGERDLVMREEGGGLQGLATQLKRNGKKSLRPKIDGII